jgi:hypothetical protein
MREHSTARLLGLGITMALGACGHASDGPSGASTSHGGTSAAPENWPKQVTLLSPSLVTASKAVRLADGELVDDAGDVALFLGLQLSLVPASSESDEIFCDHGVRAALSEVPTNDQFCAGTAAGRWAARLFLSGSIYHSNEESHVIGLSALVRSPETNSVYRLRILGDAVGPNEEGFLGIASVTFEYEPNQ